VNPIAVIGQYGVMETPSTALTDGELIAASLELPERFAPLFDRHHGPIHRYLERRSGARVAEDVAAETFVVAFRRRAAFDTRRADARPWLYGIAANLLGPSGARSAAGWPPGSGRLSATRATWMRTAWPSGWMPRR
jgi:hypothetical protein